MKRSCTMCTPLETDWGGSLDVPTLNFIFLGRWKLCRRTRGWQVWGGAVSGGADFLYVYFLCMATIVRTNPPTLCDYRGGVPS
ncbi:hypothetical protein CON71_10615 [Bacillus thuringiensis]|uniref:Uncharacterized protein n=1 Tax=Bacillus thuringiensis TaxID=1428 RepID=A0A9X6TP13_BACTU|nr:hypothetical protein CON71_10615 [Bacillus thuringiensis]